MGKDLRTFLEQIKQRAVEDFLEIEEEIDLYCETTAWVKSFEDEGKHPLILFKKIKGFDHPIVTNLFGSKKMMGLALGCSVEKLHETFRERARKLIPPRYVSSGPVKEISFYEDQVDLFQLPIPHHHEGDAAPYITGGILIAIDPENGKANCSYHRLMVAGKNRLRTHIAPGRHLKSIFQRYEERNLPLPCSIFIGHHPSLGLGSVAMTPKGVDELEVMGGMLGESLNLLKGEKVECVYPAEAEIVLEAEILPNIREEEGPFTEFTGYATGVRAREVVLVRSLFMRKDAIYHDLIPASNEHILLGLISREVHFYELAKSISPSIQAVAFPTSGVGRFHCYVSIDKQKEGEVNLIGMALLAADPLLKHVIIVDKDINIFNEKEVLWAIATRVQADRDIYIIPNCLGSDLDPSTQFPRDHEGKTAKMIIDATAKPSLTYEGYSRKKQLPKELEEKIKNKIVLIKKKASI
jgi:2,5-furandicarboxylate decarboxylase 1